MYLTNFAIDDPTPQSGPSEAEKLMYTLFLTTRRYSAKYISPITLRQTHRQYSKWRSLVKCRVGWWTGKADEKKIYEFDSYMVHYLIERCFWTRYGDSSVVCDLLLILFELDGHLGKIFDCRLLSTNPRSRYIRKFTLMSDDIHFNNRSREKYGFVSTWIGETLASEPIKPFVYFMEHANKRKVLFRGKRFAEQLIIQCIKRSVHKPHCVDVQFEPPCAKSFKFPELMPRLLQHGLFARAGKHDDDVGKLLTGIIGMCSVHIVHTDSVADILEMGNMLLRAVESVDISILMRYQKVRNRTKSIPRILSSMSVLPKLKIRCLGPQELQHLCRCQIRRCLYDAWQLPDGIQFLPLPNRQKRYLSLDLD